MQMKVESFNVQNYAASTPYHALADQQVMLGEMITGMSHEKSSSMHSLLISRCLYNVCGDARLYRLLHVSLSAYHDNRIRACRDMSQSFNGYRPSITSLTFGSSGCCVELNAALYLSSFSFSAGCDGLSFCIDRRHLSAGRYLPE